MPLLALTSLAALALSPAPSFLLAQETTPPPERGQPVSTSNGQAITEATPPVATQEAATPPAPAVAPEQTASNRASDRPAPARRRRHHQGTAHEPGPRRD